MVAMVRKVTAFFADQLVVDHAKGNKRLLMVVAELTGLILRSVAGIDLLNLGWVFFGRLPTSPQFLIADSLLLGLLRLVKAIIPLRLVVHVLDVDTVASTHVINLVRLDWYSIR